MSDHNSDTVDQYIRTAYLVLLNREPDSTGLANCRRLIKRGDGLEAVLDVIAFSDEYKRLYPGSANQVFRKAKRWLLRLLRPGTQGSTLLALGLRAPAGSTQLQAQTERIAKDQGALNLRLLSIEDALAKFDKAAETQSTLNFQIEKALAGLDRTTKDQTALGRRLQSIEDTLARFALDDVEQSLDSRIRAIESRLASPPPSGEDSKLISSNNLVASPRQAINSEAEASFLKLIALLRPVTLESSGLSRIGGYKDGAYVMAEAFADTEAAVSLGIGVDASWDTSLAERGIPIWQYDHTVEQPDNCEGPLFHFHRKRVVGRAQTPDELSLKSIFDEDGLRGMSNIVVKIDIEGNEWEVLESVPDAYWSRVSQLIVEFHDLHHAWQNEWSARAQHVLRRLRAVFTPIHLHGNNCGGLCQLGGFAFPRVVEVTFVRNSDHRFGALIESVPNADLDAPNNPDFADLRFSFASIRGNSLDLGN